jgi:hypothetical protein
MCIFSISRNIVAMGLLDSYSFSHNLVNISQLAFVFFHFYFCFFE